MLARDLWPAHQDEPDLRHRWDVALGRLRAKIVSRLTGSVHPPGLPWSADREIDLTYVSPGRGIEQVESSGAAGAG